jgi:membrane protease YdiL (CAAX protease family)
VNRRLRLLTLALLGWVMCFAVLASVGSWTPFAFVGVLLVLLTVQSSAVPPSQFRPSGRSLLVGVGAGLLMVLATHLAYDWLSGAFPRLRSGTLELFSLLNVEGFSPPARASLIVVIASCEEVLFRGLIVSAPGHDLPELRWPLLPEFGKLVLWAIAYALTTVPLASPLLVMCAFACGTLWGTLRAATGSVLVPILAHVIWDLGVLLIWPLPS